MNPPTTKKKGAKAKRLPKILDKLKAHDPNPECALDHANPFELLAATILSAQCTDERVNRVTPGLFSRFPDSASLAKAKIEDIEELVRSTGFFRNKAKNLSGMAQRVDAVYDGEIPQEMEDLLTLPGVARKTANVVRGVCWSLAEGVVVDTHVGRISQRLGLTKEKNPVKVERDLMNQLPVDEWITFSHRIIRFGRSTCQAKKPQCEGCLLDDLCPRIGV